MTLRLRALKQKDAALMLEWMHDKGIVEFLKTDFLCMKLKDCEHFIEQSNIGSQLHLAIVDDNDEYLGTVSLKNIHNQMAEFAIAMRNKAMGKGYAISAMNKIIEIGWKKYRLSSIYWCVNRNNKRAIRFYEKNGFQKKDMHRNVTVPGYSKEETAEYVWFEVKNE